MHTCSSLHVAGACGLWQGMPAALSTMQARAGPLALAPGSEGNWRVASWIAWPLTMLHTLDVM